MSPLVQPPNRGYADWQRIDNYDSGVLWSELAPVSSAPINSPILDVSRYAYICGFLGEAQSQCNVSLLWYIDAPGTTTTGARRMILSSLMGEAAQAAIPNMGPFLQAQVQAIGGANYEFQAEVFASNRVYPLEFTPQNAVLIDRQAAAIGGSSSVFVYPSDYFAGPVSIWFDPQFASGFISLNYLTAAGTWDAITQLAWTAAPDTVFTWITPPGAWRIIVDNTTVAASTYYLTVTPSITGGT